MPQPVKKQPGKKQPVKVVDAEPAEEKLSEQNPGLSFKLFGKDGESFQLRIKGFSYMRIVMYIGAGIGLIKIMSELFRHTWTR